MDEPQSLGSILSRQAAGRWEEPRPQPAPSQPAWLAPATPPEIPAILAPCLTIAAPSGMSLEDRGEWFMAAAGFLDTIPASLLREAAKRTAVDHPSKIVPAILAYAKDERSSWEWRNRPQTKAPQLTVVPTAEPELPPMTQADVDKLPDSLINIGLACGAIVRDSHGKPKPA